MSYNNTPVSPFDPTNPTFRSSRRDEIPMTADEKEAYTMTRSLRSSSESSQDSLSAQGRKARFAEDTAVISPATGPGETRSPFAEPATTDNGAAKPSDFGFGYLADNNPVEQHANMPTNLHANGQPLKSALKTPGTARFANPLSPTFRQETMLEREEEKTEKQQANDLKVKTRVRMAKIVLRGVNFSCSLIVLALLGTVLTIFRSTRHLPDRNGSPAWSKTSTAWPQIVVLTIACVSLLFSVIIIIAYCRPGGHRRAEKVAVYYTMFAVGYFIFSIVMWLVGAAVLQGTKANSNGQDIWGWSCKDNKRRTMFQQDIQYSLVCRLQDWSLICAIIEIIVEIMVISIYGVVFYRFYSKNKLRKSMGARDRARSDLYLAQLRSQSAPNTPGFAMTPRMPSFPSVSAEKNQAFTSYYGADDAEKGNSLSQYASTTPTSAQTASPFRLQAPPTKASTTPRVRQDGFEQVSTTSPASTKQQHDERQNAHADAAPGEQIYDAVPIPGAYAGSQHPPSSY